MIDSVSVAVEGLPGAGKSSLISTIRMLLPDVTVLPELLLTPPEQPDSRWFAMNDLAKADASAEQPTVLLDRTWFSTVAYVVALERLRGVRTSPRDILHDLYPRKPGLPDMCLFIDSPTALALGFASDGLFPQLRFRALLRAAYLEIFSTLAQETVTILLPDNAVNGAMSGLQQAFGPVLRDWEWSM